MERLFLLAGADLFIVVGDHPILSFLLCVVFRQRIIEHFVIHFLDWFVAIINVEVGTLAVHVLRREAAAVVCHGAFTHHSADSSFQVSTSDLINSIVLIAF